MKEFDIEHFPTSESAQRMVSRVSPIYENSYIGKWLFEVMGLEMDEARLLVESLRDQCFAERCTWGMRYWEERYGIEVDETKDLEARRSALLTKRGKKQPLSPASLEEILKSLTGRDVSVGENSSGFGFTVSIEEGTATVDYIAIIQKLNTIKPSHLAYKIELPRKGTLKMYFATAMHEFKSIAITEYDNRGVSDVVWLVDESGNTLADEDMNVFVD